MKATVVGTSPQRWSPHAEIWNALRAATPQPEPMLWGFGPLATMNPYQQLLYSAFADEGIVAAPILDIDQFATLLDYRSLVGCVGMHFHWLNFVAKGARSAAEARLDIDAFLGKVAAFKERGGVVAWTVHNTYPHDAKFVDEELRLQREFVDMCDVVHVMSPGTLAMMADVTPLDPSRVVAAPHPHYVGAYPDAVSRVQARAALGLAHDDVVLVSFGAIKPYKGLTEVREAFEFACGQPYGHRLKLVVAGGPDASAEATDFAGWALRHPQVLIDARPVAAEDTQVFLRAADVGLAAYRRNLNSGAALLYLSFGLPVVAADTPVLAETLPASVTRFVPDINDASAYARALTEAAALGVDGRLDSIADVAPRKVSRQFAQDLRARLLG